MNEQTQNVPGVQVILSINPSPAGAYAQLRFVNTSKADEAYLYKYNACADGRIRNDVFRIDSDGNKIRYTGRLAKRPEPKPEDFIKVSPGSSLEAAVRLDDAYRFLPGTHEYHIQYFALHSYSSRPGYMKLQSNPVTFTYTKQGS